MLMFLRGPLYRYSLSRLTAFAVAMLCLQTLGIARSASADTSRIVSLGGSITEIIYALHLEDHIAGVDSTSLYPPAALKEKPSVGYVRAIG